MRARRDIAEVKRGGIVRFNPDKALRTIAVAEAATRHWARAKDATKLFKAIEAKIHAQAEYIVWRDGTVIPSQNLPGAGKGKGKRIAAPKSSKLPAADPGHVVAHRWRRKFCRKEKGATLIDEARIAEALADAQHRCQRICEAENANTIRGTEGTGEFERYTPSRYIEAAREVLGEIELDPATSAIAQRTVQATRYFTVADDGLSREWHGRVWLNPPYHRELAPKFIAKLVEEYAARRVTAAIMLTNNCTDTDWFHAALAACAAVCFTKGRIRFLDERGNEVLPTQGQAFFYFGGDCERFREVFARIGFGVAPLWTFDEVRP